ncbi:MAG: chemotaxis protein CheA [Brevinematia bacterium]
MNEIGELEKVFIDESVDMIQTYEMSILRLEENPKDVEAINSAFRAVHTLKGGSASMGYNNLAKLSHVIEDLLDSVRSEKISLTQQIISVLFDGAKLLKEGLNLILQSLDLNQEDVEVFSREVERILPKEGKKPEESLPKVKSLPETISLENLDLPTEIVGEIQKILSENRKVYLLDIYFREDSPLKEVGILQVFSILKDNSQIVEMKPSLEEIYTRFFERVSFVITTEDIQKLASRVNISDIVKDIRYNEIVLSERKQESKTVKEVSDASEVKSSILRIESSKVDRLMNIVGELVVNRSNINENMFYLGEMISDISEQYYDIMRNIRSLASQISVDVKELGEEMAEKLQDYLSSITNITSMIGQTNSKITELKKRYDNLSVGIKLFNSISMEIQERVTNLRMIPIRYLFSRIPLFVREVSSQLGKEINLIIKGEDTNLDKSVIDELFDPIVHIIRNCIDHGIESKEERLRKGKPAKGNIVVEAFNEGSSVIIRIRDDGRGIDFDKIRKRGIEMGLLKEKLNYDKEYLLSLIFLPGFSTKEGVSSLSGRGVGMDIVKARVDKLRGSLLISTGKDKGTIFTIKLPLTVAIMKVLLFEIKEVIFAIPVNSIEEAITIKRDEITTFEGKSVVKIRDEVIKVYSLREIYFEDGELGEEIDVLIVSYLGKKYALVIDKFLKEEDIFLRPIDYTLVSPPGVVSATILGNGKIGYVMDIGNLVSYLEKRVKSELPYQV